MESKIETSAEAAEADVLPRLYSKICNPELQKAAKLKLPAAVANKPPSQKSAAQWAYERVVLYLKNFEEQLDSDHEVAMGFTGAQAGVLRIEGMGYFDPDIVTFYGSDPAGGRAQLIQHVSQLNVILRALPKEVKDAAPNRVGFRLFEDLENEVSGEA